MTTVIFHDRAPLEKVRRLADGRIAAVAKFARSGVQRYTGAEVGRPDLATVNVYRPESEVFDEAAMASFAHKAITLGHPAGAVTADNWQKHSVGWTEGKVARDGDYVEIPLMLADASAVKAYDSGEARELSGGYACELVWGDGVAPDGTRYQATQRQIRGNHIAQVPKGRAGEMARIGDSAMNMITDADRPALQAHIAFERNKHDLGQAHRGAAALPWTDAMTQAATQRFLDKKGTPIGLADRSAYTTDADRLAVDKAAADRAYAKSTEYLNDWRKGQ